MTEDARDFINTPSVVNILLKGKKMRKMLCIQIEIISL